MNITQYGEDSMTDLHMYSKQERKDSVKDILNLGFTAQFESEVAPKLPNELSGALRFQQENMAAAVSILALFIVDHLFQMLGICFSNKSKLYGSLQDCLPGSVYCSL